MLYHAYELNHAVISPMRQWADFGRIFMGSPFNPAAYTSMGKSMVAALDLFESVTRRYGKPEWGISETTVNGCSIPVQDRIIFRKPFCDLVHFKRDPDLLSQALGQKTHQPRVLLVAPLSGHYATLLRGTVEAFIPDHEVYITDWIDARTVPYNEGTFDLNDYIDYLIEMIKFLGPDINIIAICQPGPAVISAVSVLSEKKSAYLPATMTIMGSPIDTRLSPTVPNQLAKEHPISWFKKKMIYDVPWPNRGFMRRVYPGFIQLGGFITMNQDRHVGAHWEFFLQLVKGDCDSTQKHRKFYDEYLSVLDLTEKFYLQTIQDVFQEHKLANGTFTHKGKRVKPEKITSVGLMTVEGELDDISGIGQTQAAHTLCNQIPESKRFDYIQPGVGHYGVFSGTRFKNDIRPRIVDFIKDFHNAKKETEFQEKNPELFF